ncbi:hypothetical protein [Shewanella frigidimarina]|uniref:hypothetical protein n=1 Tax=Shewanella frigidimarina TaxID=56812 RepID=UPI003D79D7F6
MNDDLSWIKNDEQCLWIQQYLARKGFHAIDYEENAGPKEQVKFQVSKAKGELNQYKLIQKTKAAWNKSQSRKKRESEGFVTQSMEITKSSQKKLKALAARKQCSQNVAITKLIEEAGSLTASLSEQLKTAKKELDEERQKRKLLTSNISDRKDSKPHIDQLEEMIISMSRTMIEQNLKLQTAEAFNTPLNKAQKQEVQQKLELKIQTLKEKGILQLNVTYK